MICNELVAFVATLGFPNFSPNVVPPLCKVGNFAVDILEFCSLHTLRNPTCRNDSKGTNDVN